MNSSGDHRTVPEAQGASPTRRRSLLLGAGVAGAAALATRALPGGPAEPAPVPADKRVDEQGGYRLTQHILRYYETTKV